MLRELGGSEPVVEQVARRYRVGVVDDTLCTEADPGIVPFNLIGALEAMVV